MFTKEWWNSPTTRLQLLIVTIVLILFFGCGCNQPKVEYFEDRTELDTLFDADNVSTIKARKTLDSLSVQKSVTTEDILIIDSITRLLNEDLSLEELAEGQNLKRLVVHCTASDIKNPYTRETLLRFFKENQHWSKPGYTFFFDRQGNIWKLNQHWDWDPLVNYSEITFGARGYNSTSLHIAWDGGVDGRKILDNRTEAQKVALRTFIATVVDIYPNIEVVGHKDLPNVNKACPIFDVRKEYKDILKKQ